jgi:hypothetical protein
MKKKALTAIAIVGLVLTTAACSATYTVMWNGEPITVRVTSVK